MFIVEQDGELMYEFDNKSKVYCKAKYYHFRLFGFNVYGKGLMFQGHRSKETELLGTFDYKYEAQSVVDEITMLHKKGRVEIYTVSEAPDVAVDNILQFVRRR